LKTKTGCVVEDSLNSSDDYSDGIRFAYPKLFMALTSRLRLSAQDVCLPTGFEVLVFGMVSVFKAQG